MSILCVGQSVVDITFPLEKEMIENHKYGIQQKFECIGGPATNAAYLCAKWNTKTYLISRIGNDANGNRIVYDLNEIGVDTNYMIRANDFSTPFSIVINHVQSGNRTIFNYSEKLEDLEYNIPSDVSVILVDACEQKIASSIISKLPNAISILDAGSVSDRSISLAKQVDYLVCSQDFAQGYAQEEINLEDIDKRNAFFYKVKTATNGQLIITLGENGLLYEDNNVVKHLPAYPTKVVDTCGAGDIFHGAFAYGIEKKMPLIDILKLASKSASISVSRIGSQTSIPSIDEVINEGTNE